MTDISIKEEDREIDIDSYSSSVEEETAKAEDSTEEETATDEDDLPVDVDKVYEEE